MNLAIIHFHLDRGGVSHVIAGHLRALDSVDQDVGHVALLYGRPRQGWPETLADELGNLTLSYHEIDGLDYETEDRLDSDALLRNVADTLDGLGFTSENTLLHVHNHSLGKNASLIGVLAGLARNGYRMLLQVHDFVEDFRPEGYRHLTDMLRIDTYEELAARLYPQAPQVHYAVLNRRDHTILTRAGTPPERVHWLPNPVTGPGTLPDRAGARDKLASAADIRADTVFVTYPVRGIRRKNVGEMLLWSLLAGDDVVAGITLAPANPVELPRYEFWKALATELELPVRFGLADYPDMTYEEILAASDALLTTSVAEGFGLVFLEAWLVGKVLTGRNLEDITADFATAGLSMKTLGTRLVVPLDWVGTDRFLLGFSVAFTRVLAAYGQDDFDATGVGVSQGAWVADNVVDFAHLPVDLQQTVIEKVAAERDARQTLVGLNPWVRSFRALDRGAADALISHNADVVAREYSLPASGQRLTSVYRKLSESRPATNLEAPARGDVILGSFLEAERFHPLRTES